MAKKLRRVVVRPQPEEEQPRKVTDVMGELAELKRMVSELSDDAEGRTLAELAEEFLAKKVPTIPRSGEEFARRIRRHVLRGFGECRSGGLDHHGVKAWMLTQRLAPETLVAIKSAGSQLVAYAQEIGEWGPNNPFALAAAPPIDRRAGLSLTLDEARRTLITAGPELRALFAVAMYLGLRKGEMFGLRRADVDVKRRILHVLYSHEHVGTKNGRSRKIHIPPRAWVFVEEALKASRGSEFLFPGKGGKRRHRYSSIAKLLKWTLIRAGITDGWRVRCRVCGRQDLLQVADEPMCPNCGGARYALPAPKAVRFHDLRHTCATLHVQAGCHPVVVALMLGHSLRGLHTLPPEITMRYLHADDEWARAQLSLLDLG